MSRYARTPAVAACFSALQRAEIAEISRDVINNHPTRSFSALQRAEIAEIGDVNPDVRLGLSFSALQRAEIAEIYFSTFGAVENGVFQCSSTSRNC